MARLADIIQKPAIQIEPHEPLARAARRMYDERVGSLLVVDGHDRLSGIFTERDLLRACAAGVDTHTATVGGWMTEDPVTASADAEVRAALQTMIDNEFRHLPVLGEGGLLGVVSMRDITRALQQERMG